MLEKIIDNKHISITSCQDVSDIILPCLKPHGVTVFNYYRIYFDRRVIRLSTDAAWTKHYFQKGYLEKLTLPDSYLTNKINYYIWMIDDCHEMLLDAALNFNTSNGITIAEINKDYIEYFCFASTKDNSRIINTFYLNNLEALRDYSYLFKDKASKIIQESLKSPIVLSNLNVCKANLKPENSSRRLLSNRQRSCANFLLEGYTCKMISEKLNLSPRTIEFYISNLKKKLSCHNKAELILKLNNLANQNKI